MPPEEMSNGAIASLIVFAFFGFGIAIAMCVSLADRRQRAKDAGDIVLMTEFLWGASLCFFAGGLVLFGFFGIQSLLCWVVGAILWVGGAITDAIRLLARQQRQQQASDPDTQAFRQWRERETG